MKRSLLRLAAILLVSVLMTSLAATAASAAIAGPSAPSFSAVMRHTPKTLFPVPGTAILTVTDAETGLPVAGARYDLFRASLYGGADTKIGSYVTDKDGKITVDHVTTGTLYWTAASAVEGYAADEEKHTFTIWAAQFTETEIALAKPAPEPEPEPEDDGYVALDLEKAAALAAFIDENGYFNEGQNADFYLLPAYYSIDETRTMEVNLVHYVDENALALAFGRAMVDNETDAIYSVAIITLNNKAEKYYTYTDENGVDYYMIVDAKNFSYTLDPFAVIWTAAYEDLKALLQEDDSEAPAEIHDRMIVELVDILVDFQGVMEYWGLDMTVDDIGFPLHDLPEAVTFEADAE